MSTDQRVVHVDKDAEIEETKKPGPDVIFLIYCGTGCTCCNYENHRRGPYKSREDAKRRIGYYKHKDSEFWPVASQYSRRGQYTIEEYEVEYLSDNRYIVDDEVYHGGLTCVVVSPHGLVVDNESERFD
jgi:hypothetical protein